MSGHSKWSTIKRQKGIVDSKRSAAFSKLGRLITIAARTGGQDPAMNFRLRLAIDKARAANMPNSNIDRAIAAGGDQGKGETSEEALYEGFGPGGVAVMIQAVTDNPNRTSSEIRALLSKAGGTLGAQHSVGWMFALRGVLRLPTGSVAADRRESFMLSAIDAGAEDVRDEADELMIVTAVDKLPTVAAWVKQQGATPTSAQLELLPTTTVAVSETARQNLFQFFEALDAHPDVTDFFSNDA